MGLRDDVERARQEVLRKDAEAAQAKAKAEAAKLESNVAPALAALPGLMKDWSRAMNLEKTPDIQITELSYEPGAPSEYGMVTTRRETQLVTFTFEEDGISFMGEVEVIGADPGRERGGEAEPPRLNVHLIKQDDSDPWPGPRVASLEDLARALMQLEEQNSGSGDDDGATPGN